MKALAVLAAGAIVAALWAVVPRSVAAHEALTTTVLFDREIVRILNQRCVMCHAENSLSFPLETYEQAWFQGPAMRIAALSRHMPPWSAVQGYGQFSNDNGLTPRETQFIVSWVEGKGPRKASGVFLNVVDASVVPAPEIRAHVDVERWRLGEPTLEYKLAANAIAPNSPIAIKRTTIDLALSEDRWIRGIEYMPGDRRVVRAVSFTLEGTGEWLGSWTPWQSGFALPTGLARRVPAGSRIIAEVHYQSASVPVVDQGTLGLFVADRASQKPLVDLVLEGKSSTLSGDGLRRVHVERSIAADTDVLALQPDLQPGIKSIDVSIRNADGTSEVLLFAKDIAVDWPTPYLLREPMLLRKGTRVEVTAYYDAKAAPAPTGIRLRMTAYRN